MAAALIVWAGCAAGAPPAKMNANDSDASVPGGMGGSASGAGGMSGAGAGGGGGMSSGTGGEGGAGGTGGMNMSGAGGEGGGQQDAGPDAMTSPGDCDDGAKNGAETDTDCGGPDCEPCPDGDTCLEDEDCAGGACGLSFVCTSPACDDGTKNGDETDQDCGGSCDAKCANGKSCAGDDDCQSGVCTDDKCACAPLTPAEACTASQCGQKSNGCGGMVTCPMTCGDGQMCTNNACVTPPSCDPNNCSNSCIPFVQTRCCQSNGTCGCRTVIGGSCS